MTRQERREARRVENRRLCERIGTYLYLFRRSPDRYQKRLIIISHGAHHEVTTPQTFRPAGNVTFLFVRDYGKTGDLRTITTQSISENLVKQKDGDNAFAPANAPHQAADIVNYTLSKTLGYHAGDTNDQLVLSYRDVQATLAKRVDKEEARLAFNVLVDPNLDMTAIYPEIAGLPENERPGVINNLKQGARDLVQEFVQTEYDVLSIRNRWTNRTITLKYVYDKIKDKGYSEILCGFCRVIYDSAGEQVDWPAEH